MQKGPNILQTIILAVFGVGIILAVLIFSGKFPIPKSADEKTGPTGAVVMWGTLPYEQMVGLTDAINQKNPGLKLSYSEKKPETIQAELVNALSSGKGPDIFMMGPGEVAQNIDRLSLVPFTAYPETVFKNTFADSGNTFLTNTGILAFPFVIDPMIMYYNQDILTSNFITEPPKTWNDLATMVPLLVQKNDAGTINQSAVALGTASNVSYPKDIVVLRILQKGDSIIKFVSNKWQMMFESGTALPDTLSWYSSFIDPKSPVYSWNPSLPKDRDWFTAGKLAFYFGYPTELETIRKKNPNLNFAVAMVPQESLTARKTDYGRIYSLGISKVSKNTSGALGVINILTSKDILTSAVANTFYAPARKDLLSSKPRDDAERALVYNSAIISKQFLDPDAGATKQLFVTAMNQINAGTRTPIQSVQPIMSALREMVSKMIPPVKEVPLE